MEKEDKAALVPKLRFPEFRNAEPWNRLPLSELLRERKQRNRDLRFGPREVLSVSGDHGCVNQIELLGRSYAGASVKEYHVVETGDLVYTKSPLKRNPYGIIKENKGKPGIVSTLYAVYHVTKKGHPAYLDYFFSSDYNLNSYLQPIVRKGAKNDMKVNNAAVLTGEIWAPQIEEQRKIADCLSSLGQLVSAQRQKVEALKTYKRGLMQQLFPCEGESRPQFRFPEFRTQPEWDALRIAELKPFVTSGSRGWAAYYANHGSLFVRITNLSRDSISLDLTDSKFVNLPSGASEGVRTQLRTHDILISITADIGIVGYVDDNVPSPAYINQHIALVRFENTNVCSKFVAYFLASDAAQRSFRSSTDNGTKAGMNLIGVQSMPLLLPTLPEQQRIASFLSSLDSQISAEAQKLLVLKAHSKGLMQCLFPSPEEV
ncbi:restriction endonuclease subunit S [Azotobacter salinestris]|uniref:restriction endonuclease subunit S n=1 Tax=Azotobacter salinestris TaxID=69964 RepID=UPI001266AC3E|nr:restriction endonuclease subunit S [Azotobacter salinestris]